MIAALTAIALKSLLVAGAALGLLRLMKRRSAAERSWVAHVGLLALVLLAFAPLVMPSWAVEAPAIMGSTASTTESASAPVARSASPAPAGIAAEPASASLLSPELLAAALYGLPAAILLMITALALARLIALRARADVLVDGHWLSALARAQRRMGFKHGTALLTSDDLASPISWGLMRPVILLNSRAVEAAGEAEAIIAHELAHVARMDWAKLLLARVATALFWFNPLVWMLAREAHQLREETADDAVLAADIVDTDYAQLLVGVARHDCPGLMLGAHGVAPSRTSLGRRIARVLDGTSARGPVARSFGLGVFAGAVLVSAPLAALTLIPGGSNASPKSQSPAAGEPALATILSAGVQASVDGAMAAVHDPLEGALEEQLDATIEREVAARVAAKARAEAATRTSAATASAVAAARAAVAGHDLDATDRATALRAIGATPEYVSAMRSASPALAQADAEEFVGMKAVGVTPAYVRELTAAGFGNADPDELTSARATGLTGAYVRQMRAAGVTGAIDEFIQLNVLGIRPENVRKLGQRGIDVRDADAVLENWPLAKDFQARLDQQLRESLPPRLYGPPPLPPRPPAPPNPPG